MSDWTSEDGVANASSKYDEIVEVVNRMILDSGSSLIQGQSHAVARTIVSTLAHKYGMAPQEERYVVDAEKKQQVARKDIFGMKVVNGLTHCDIVEWTKDGKTRRGWLSPHGHPFKGYVYTIVSEDTDSLEILEELIEQGIQVKKIGELQSP